MVKFGKASKIGLILSGVIALTALSIGGAIWISHIETRKAEAQFPACQGAGAVHKADIRDGRVVPVHTDAERCDTLVITNLDDQPRIIAFGRHEHHTPYDGVTERYLSPRGTFSVKLVQTGTFRFHDHDDDAVQGTFTVR